VTYKPGELYDIDGNGLFVEPPAKQTPSDQRIGNYIQTFSSRAFYPLDPRASEVCIEDIAHALSALCRFTGHCKHFYSVAQHSVLVSHLCDPADALWGLLHDATEAYVADVARPLKHSPEWAPFREVERLVSLAVAEHFGLPPREPESVILADQKALGIEALSLMQPLVGDGWKRFTDLAYNDPLTRGVRVGEGFGPARAKAEFMRRYEELTGL